MSSSILAFPLARRHQSIRSQASAKKRQPRHLHVEPLEPKCLLSASTETTGDGSWDISAMTHHNFADLAPTEALTLSLDQGANNPDHWWLEYMSDDARTGALMSPGVFFPAGSLLAECHGITEEGQQTADAGTDDVSAETDMETAHETDHEDAPGESVNKDSSPCPEGYFLNLMDGACAALDTDYGFDPKRFQSKVGTAELTLSPDSCTEEALLAILEELENAGGGTLQLPSCEIGLTKPIYVPSHSVLQGAGMQQTILFAAPGWGTAGSIVRVYDKTVYKTGWQDGGHEDVVLRDFTVRGHKEVKANNIEILWSDNVLVERVESYEAGKSALHFGHARQITIRYSTFHHSYRYHGIGSKDCIPTKEMDGEDQDSLVSKSECSQGDPNFWSESYVIHSNQIHHNGAMGLDSHASNGEVAGNLLTNNVWSSKFPEPAHDIWVHDNLFDGGTYWGTKIGNQYAILDETMDPVRQVYYRNQFSNNGTYGVRLLPASEIYFIENVYRSNGYNNATRLTNERNAVVACQGDEVAGAAIAGNNRGVVWLEADDPVCDLSLISALFQ
jgi:hypothetical protein